MEEDLLDIQITISNLLKEGIIKPIHVEVLDLSCCGWSYREIGDFLGITKDTTQDYLAFIIEEIKKNVI